MNRLLVTASVVPVNAEPQLGSEQVSQMVLGEGARILDRQGDFLLIEVTRDDYQGWVHGGYVMEVDATRHDAWVGASDRSLGATLRVGANRLDAPYGSLLHTRGESGVRLPDGKAATVESGSVVAPAQLFRSALEVNAADWAWQQFGGTPYLWGGVTERGIDCSGLVQASYAARGVNLPRDARQQVKHGIEIGIEQPASGDLAYFGESGSERITHVALVADSDTIVHSTVALGGVVREGWGPGSRAASLRDRLVAVRRLN